MIHYKRRKRKQWSYGVDLMVLTHYAVIITQTGELSLQSSQRGQVLPEQATKLLQVLREGQLDSERRISFSFADALRKVIIP